MDPTRNKGGIPTAAQIQIETRLLGLPDSDAEALHDHWLANGYKTGRNPVKDWRAVVRTWKRREYFPSQKVKGPTPGSLMTNEILDALAANPSYTKVDVQKEAWRFKQWCQEKNVQPLVTSFVKFLNAKL